MVRKNLIVAISIASLGGPAFSAVEQLSCEKPENANQEQCLCRDSNIENLTAAQKDICVTWLANGGVPAAGLGVTNFAPLIAPVAGVLGAAVAAGAGGSTTGTTGTTSTTGTN